MAKQVYNSLKQISHGHKQQHRRSRDFLMLLQIIFNPLTFTALVLSWYLVRFYIQPQEFYQFNGFWLLIFTFNLTHLLFVVQILNYFHIRFNFINGLPQNNTIINSILNHIRNEEILIPTLVSLPISTFIVLLLILSCKKTNFTNDWARRKLCKIEMKPTRLIKKNKF